MEAPGFEPGSVVYKTTRILPSFANNKFVIGMSLGRCL